MSEHAIDQKKMAAAMAAVMKYIKSYEVAQAGMSMPPEAPSAAAAAAVGQWAVSGRLDSMQIRRLIQMRTFR